MNKASMVVDMSWKIDEIIAKRKEEIKNLQAVKYNLETCYSDYTMGGVDDFILESVIAQTKMLLNKMGYLF